MNIHLAEESEVIKRIAEGGSSLAELKFKPAESIRSEERDHISEVVNQSIN